MFDLVIRNGLVVNADGTQSADVGIAGETIVQVGGDIAGAAREIDAGGLYVMPGGVDVHTHLDLDLPGFQTADDFRTGTIAAACGGTTTVLDFCQQRHGQSLREALDIWHAKAGGKAVTDYGFHIVITDMNADVEKELAELPSQGITSFKLFMAYKDAQMVDDRTMLRVFDVARTEGALVMVHAENGDAADYLIEKAVAAGNLSTINHALTRPPRVESEATGRAIALAELIMAEGLPIRLRLLVPAVENSIAGNAFRPGDVITTRAGISVEIDNTDAEGRLVLCDALAYAGEQPTDLILDFATLTGAARVALGPELPALYSNRDSLLQGFADAAKATADPLWPMPLWTPYLRYLDSGIADLANSSATHMGGSITAALYLQRFVPTDRDWCHFDVYAWNDSDRPGHPAGGEAQALRASFAWIEANLAQH